MAKSHNQKIKILILEEILRDTDAAKVVTMQEILDRLGQYGISAERKSIYDDMEALRDFGYDIQYKRGRTGGYYLNSGVEKRGDRTAAEGQSSGATSDTEAGDGCGSEHNPEKETAAWRISRKGLCDSGKNMKLLCSQAREKEIREYFGDLAEYKLKTEGYLTVSLPRVQGPEFFGWLTVMGKDVRNVKPRKTAAAYRDYLKILAREYKGL